MKIRYYANKKVEEVEIPEKYKWAFWISFLIYIIFGIAFFLVFLYTYKSHKFLFFFSAPVYLPWVAGFVGLAGGILVGMTFAALLYARDNWKPGGGDGPPPNPYWGIIIFIAISIIVYGFLIMIFDLKQLADRATVWSAVYGSIMSTASFLIRRQ